MSHSKADARRRQSSYVKHAAFVIVDVDGRTTRLFVSKSFSLSPGDHTLIEVHITSMFSLLLNELITRTGSLSGKC